MTSLSGMIGYSVALAALPAVAEADAPDERQARAHEYVFLTALSTTVVVIPLLLLTPDILRIVFGPDFVPATDVTRILLVASIALGTGRVLGAALKEVDRPLDAGIAEGVGFVVTAIRLAVLLPILDLKGAAIASVAAYTASAAVGLHLADRALGRRGLHLLRPGSRRDLET